MVQGFLGTNVIFAMFITVTLLVVFGNALENGREHFAKTVYWRDISICACHASVCKYNFLIFSPVHMSSCMSSDSGLLCKAGRGVMQQGGSDKWRMARLSVLGLSDVQSTDTEIRAAYKKMALKSHPGTPHAHTRTHTCACGDWCNV